MWYKVNDGGTDHILDHTLENSKYFILSYRNLSTQVTSTALSHFRLSSLCLVLHQVIPLSQRSGIVEWCEDTMPLGEYLIGRPGTKTGAHSRYYPGDWTSLDCRKKVKVMWKNVGF